MQARKDSKIHRLCRFTFGLLTLGFVAVSAPREVGAALSVTPEGAASFLLVETLTVDGVRWYDAEVWFRRLPGTTDAEEGGARVTYREANSQLTVLAAPPYALRGSRPLADSLPTRVVDGRLTVAERFLVERSSDFLGRPVAVEPVHGTGTLRVVIDPGHGGGDRGSMAPGAPAEKAAVLPVAQELATQLRKRGFEVRLTREDDRTVTFAERAALANQWKADLFLSLHASGSARPQARGYEVFLAQLSPLATDPRVWSAGQLGFTGESRRWANAVHAEVGRTVASFDRGVREMPSPLLEAITAPACLLEAGNLSWPEDVEVFTKPQARATLAKALGDAVEAFFGAPR